MKTKTVCLHCGVVYDVGIISKCPICRIVENMTRLMENVSGIADTLLKLQQ